MSHPLDGCWAKIERAKEQISNLDAEITALLASGVYSIVGENQPERRRYAFKLLGPPVPLRFAVIAGEIVHHLRSAFDHVVWALAKKNAIPDDERIQFPVCDTPEKFEKAVRGGTIKGVSRTDRPLIEALQPHRASDPANSLLRVVHDLDIADKHKLLVVVTHALFLGKTLVITKNNCTDPSFGIELPPTATDSQGRIIARYPSAIEAGVEVHWIPLRGPPNPEFEAKNDATIQVVFEQVGTLKREQVIPILVQLSDGVEPPFIRSMVAFDASHETSQDQTPRRGLAMDVDAGLRALRGSHADARLRADALGRDGGGRVLIDAQVAAGYARAPSSLPHSHLRQRCA
jgi:hypothetical protein